MKKAGLEITLRNQRGFTLVEIIATLIIIGILAAVALPKYLDMQDDAREKAAQGAIAEGKGRLNIAYGKLLLKYDGATDSAHAGNRTELITEARLSSADDPIFGSDFTASVGPHASDSTKITINITNVKGDTVSVSDDWDLPQ